MRLAAKPFVISLLVILVLAAVGFLSFYAVGNLVSVNREIATHTIPAVRLAATTREAITPLVRLEMRALVLADPGYATAWNERAARVTEDLERLAGSVQSAREAALLAAARSAFEQYRGLVCDRSRTSCGAEPGRRRSPCPTARLASAPRKSRRASMG